MTADLSNTEQLINDLDELAKEKGYTKIIAKIPQKSCKEFESRGYIQEANIPGFFRGEEDGCFVSRYLDTYRSKDPLIDKCSQIVQEVKGIRNNLKEELLDDYKIRKLEPNDVGDMVKVYRSVFKTYPFPIHDKNYLIKTMEENLVYYGVFHKNKLVAIASIELSKEYSNAELTDFATLEDHRGKGLASQLLRILEEKLVEINIHTAYTIARARSFGMNAVFAKQNYIYGGTLINNTDIAGQIESMNIWYKTLYKVS